MDMPKYTCGYTGGMNKDISPNNYPNTCYFDATNYRIITSDSAGLSDSSLSTIKGNAVSFTIPNSGKLLGYSVLRDNLIILVNAVGETNPDRIYRIPLSSLQTAQNLTLTNTYYWNSGYLVYWNDLNFNVANPIKVIANYESDDIQKIYWVDGLNSLRHLNIVYNATYNDLSTLDPELLEISPNHTYGTYNLAEQTGGHLKAGRIQYSYQLYSISGTETMFAPPSNLYNLTTYSSTDGYDFAGNDLETSVNKSLSVTITLPNDTANTFNRIRLLALEYEIYGDIPKIRVVTEQELNTDEVVFYDYGDSIGEISIEEFQIIKNDLVPTTIESVKNYLFAGNVVEEFFDVDDTVAGLSSQARDFLDTRAYRWRYMTGAIISSTQNLTYTTDPHSIANIPGYTGAGSYDTIPAFISLLSDASWIIDVRIGAPEHAAAQSPVRTVTGVSAITSSEIRIDFYTSSWVNSLRLISPSGFYYTPEDANHGILHIWGTQYAGTKPSGLSPAYPSGGYTKTAITALSYDYTYTYTPVSGVGVDCVLNKGMDDNFVVDDGTTLNYDIPETHDCINIYNDIVSDESLTRADEYKYKKITSAAPPTITDLGGTGRYISYGFIYTDIVAGTVTTKGEGTDLHPIVSSLTGSDIGYKNPSNVLSYTGHQRDEVYRYGLVLYDLKGRPSFTKWIGDIRLPKMNEELNPETTWSTVYELCHPIGARPSSIFSIRALGIQFTINWTAIETDHPGLIALLSGLQFVRMPRTADDCTIKASGIIVPTLNVTTAAGYIKDTKYSTYQIASGKDYIDTALTTIPGITSTNCTMNRKLMELISPEIAINKNILIDPTNDFLQPVGYIDDIDYKISTVGKNSYTVSSVAVSTYNTTNTKIKNSWRRPIMDGVLSLPESKSPTTLVINTINYTPRGYDGKVDASSPNMTYKGTSLVVDIGTEFTDVTSGGSAGESKAMYGYYRKYLGYSIYGGCTYSERSYNQYIKASEFTAVSTSGSVNYSIYNGDTYINAFAFLKLAFDTSSEYGTTHSGQVFVTFPVESRIDLAYRLDKINKYFYPDDTYDYFLQEYYTTGFSQYPNTYPGEVGNLYRYNSAYSAENISKVYPTKPFDFRSSNQQDVLVTSSERKLSGEYKDSWLTFKYNNYLELDGVLGSITRLLNKNDKLLAFQQRGIASLSVLERELVATNNAQVATGSGGILSRSDYISRNIGTSNYYGIVDTETGIYFYNDNDSSIYRIGNGLEPISDTKGMKSYFDTYKFTSLIGTYDKRNREVLFSPGTTHAQNTLCFSGFADLFTGFYSLKNNSDYVEKYINFDKYMLSSVDSNIFYLHDAGNYNQFYGITHPSTITVLPNPAKSMAVSFQTIEWLMDVTNAGVEVAGETFDSVHITNTHQDTGVLTFPGTTGLMRRFRTWRINVFRDSLIANSYGRIRDSWIKAKFSYTPSNTNDKAIVHPIDFFIQPTKIR